MLLQTARDANAVAIHYVNGAAQHLDRMAQSPGHVLGFDWRLPIGEVRRRVPARYALQGNLDPTALYCDEATLRRKVAAVCRDGGDQHIFNLGHGILPSADPEAVAIVVDEVRKS
jgi:uroporphyrinogen decarboxylase